MESTREERMQQRLRGAQRQVKDVDFGFMLPAFAIPPVEAPAGTIPDSLPEALAKPETPRSDLPSQPIIQTPVTATKGRGRSPNILGLQSNNVAKSNTGNDANTSAKRRKLETDEPPSSSTRSMRSSRSSARKDIYDIPADDEEEQIEVENSQLPAVESLEGNESERKIVATTPTATEIAIESIERDPSNEIIAASDNEELTKIADQSSPEEIDLPTTNQSDSPKVLPRPSRNKRKRNSSSSNHSGLDHSAVIEDAFADTTNDSLEEVPLKQPRRSSRKSAVQVEVEGHGEDVPEDSTEQAEAIDDYEAAVTLKKSRGRRISRHIVASDEPILEDEAPPRSPTAKKKRGRVRQVTSPVQQRQPAPPKPKSQKPNNKSKKAEGLVHDDDDSNADMLNSEIPCATRAGVNAVDVLSQICQELVTAGLETLGDNAIRTQDPAQRLEYKTKIRAIESFSKALQVRLLEHTINLDNSYSLEKRLRESQKKKLSLREEILRVRAEREKVALRMDEIRIAHEKDSHEAEQHEVLNRTAHDIELAVERGRSSSSHTDDGKANLELILKRVASEASSASGDGGILKQIKAFNAFMERAALALEGRKNV
ncbi:hypothetical protein EYC84_007108 [Monilinia fructicola]|uniref:Inner kinetochore subunit AME1 domain-containing protein n=1 Tax=Monilinia fructicola TaxID=38448 RepID=A0A5M9K5K3_MONFR|nr:hypothetical protein EYC84_007108 [Monilinia fructicola]